jgi:hypothetical protein
MLGTPLVSLYHREADATNDLAGSGAPQAGHGSGTNYGFGGGKNP